MALSLSCYGNSNEEDGEQGPVPVVAVPAIAVLGIVDPGDDIKDVLCRWALQEVLERQQEERRKRFDQRNKKWIIGGIGVITTVIPLITSIVQATQNDVCTEPGSTELSSSFNISW